VYEKSTLNGLDELIAVIDRKAQQKMAGGRRGEVSYKGALVAVALEEPDLFLTKARLELDATYRYSTIYFDVSPSGQLINPAVMQSGGPQGGGKLVPLPSPLDTTPLDPNMTPDQEMAVRVASQMKVAMSDGRRPTYREAALRVASENPNLMRRRERGSLR
jgi:hypothetical protein